ncbi:MAG: Asp-tRNA(Asn)/Glu-tRNA(Gln) amidotransferase subunit GatC [Candidatus Lokiarchaeota archaeon]|nr:Asp-tRNA(Asn)/Glu-tRNA(Gln) amidotransferase subunit GatC [Candidatus Lokiarchaeota archaeon]
MTKDSKLTIEDTQEIAKLARLQLSKEEEEKFTTQLNNILQYFEKLSELDTKNVEPRTHPNDIVNSFREDVVEESLDKEEALKNAPEKKDSYFKAPKIV